MKRDPYRFQLLAPTGGSRLAEENTTGDTALYERYLNSLQRLRGRLYLADGAIQPCHLDVKGRHRMSDDEHCWHFLLVDQQEEVIACARFRVHSGDADYDQLRVSRTPLASDSIWGSKLRWTTEQTLREAWEEDISYAELGGWAITPEYRHTKAALEILIGSYAWAELIGGCKCCCTATVRNSSSSILRRIGARSLEYNGEALPAYFDEQYGCTMEILSFDSRQLPPKFIPILNEMRPKLAHSEIVSKSTHEDSFSVSLGHLVPSVAKAGTLPFQGLAIMR